MNASAHPIKTGLIARFFGARDAGADAALIDGDSIGVPAEFHHRHGAKIEEMCVWLAQAGLEPTTDTLSLAWHMLTGSGQAGFALVAKARDEDGRIDMAAVPHLMIALGLRPDRRAINAMIDAAKFNVDNAQALTGDSSAALADYRTAMADPIDALADPNRAKAALSDVQLLTSALLERTLTAEGELRKTAEVMSELRERLAETQKQALADPLTKLPNRRAFELALSKGLEACDKDRPLCVAFIDIDHFKRVNDSHGHATGDRVLCYVAKMLSRLSNDNCHVARHGGEEFALIFEGLNAKESFDRLDEARQALADASLRNRDNGEPIGKLSFSAGLAQHKRGESASRLLARADAALYAAKAAGRDNIHLATATR